MRLRRRNRKERKRKMTELTIKVEMTGLEGLTQAIMALAERRAAEAGTREAGQTPQAALPAQMAAGFQTGITQPAGNTVPVQGGAGFRNAVPVTPMHPVLNGGTPAGGALAGAVPTTAMPPEFTLDQLSVAAAGLVNQGKQSRLLELLRGFGANSLVEIPKERYGELAAALRAEGAVI